jgi:hypothetical protein
VLEAPADDVALNDNAPPPAAVLEAPPAALEAPPAALEAPPAALEAPPAALDATAIAPVEKDASASPEEASSSSPLLPASPEDASSSSTSPPAELKDAGAAPLVSSDKLPENNLNTSNDDASKQLQKALELRAKLDNTIDYLKTLTASDGVSTESKTLTASDGVSTESKTLTASDGVSGASTESKTLTASDGASTGAASGGGKKKKINKTRYKKYNSNMSLKRKHKTNKISDTN